jgi:hypothetical protein
MVSPWMDRFCVVSSRFFLPRRKREYGREKSVLWMPYRKLDGFVLSDLTLYMQVYSHVSDTQDIFLSISAIGTLVIRSRKPIKHHESFEVTSPYSYLRHQSGASKGNRN